MAPNSARSSPAEIPAEIPSERVQISTRAELRRMAVWRAILAALIAGLGGLAAAASGDSITLQGYLTAAATAAAAAGAVLGVRPNGSTARTVMPLSDLQELKRHGGKHEN